MGGSIRNDDAKIYTTMRRSNLMPCPKSKQHGKVTWQVAERITVRAVAFAAMSLAYAKHVSAITSSSYHRAPVYLFHTVHLTARNYCSTAVFFQSCPTETLGLITRSGFLSQSHTTVHLARWI